jgi:hypothetical protein
MLALLLPRVAVRMLESAGVLHGDKQRMVTRYFVEYIA